MKFKLTTLIVCLSITAHLHCQESILVSGAVAIGTGGSSSYSIGQLSYTTNTGDGSVSQGVQQSFELFTLSNPELTTVNLSALTYPNPTSDYIVLAISDASITDLSYAIYDLQGKIVAKGLVAQANTQIGMQDLSIGTYLLKVNQNNAELKSFKIIKK